MFSGHIIRSCLVCLALALTGGGVFAQVNAADSAFQKFFVQVTGVGKQTIGYGSGGQLVVGQGVPQISTAGGPVLVDRAVPVLNNSGGQITANARVSVPPTALARILRKGLAAVPVLGTGIALYDVLTEIGYTASKDANGTLAVGQQLPDTDLWRVCDNGTCSTQTNVRASSAAAACVAHGKTWKINPNQGTYTCYITSTYVATPTKVAGTNQPGQVQPRTLDELENAIASQSGWPSGSRVSQAVADATELVPADPFTSVPQVTGPATSPGDTATTENPDGSTTTKTTTYNHTYTGPTINTTTQTITSTCTGGSCNTTTTTETPKVEEQPFTMPCGVAGTPPCEVRLDQSGMPPDGGRPFDQASGEVDPERDSLLSKLSEIEEFELGDWTWTFQLPTGCTPLTMFLGVEVNPCAWQAEIHDIMSVIWILTGIAGAFVIFSRAFQ